MRRTPLGRGTALAASAAALCLAALAAGMGGGGPDQGYLATEAVGPDDARAARPVPPGDGVRLVPLDGSGDPTAPGTSRAGGGHDPDSGAADAGSIPGGASSSTVGPGGTADSTDNGAAAGLASSSTGAASSSTAHGSGSTEYGSGPERRPPDSSTRGPADEPPTPPRQLQGPQEPRPGDPGPGTPVEPGRPTPPTAPTHPAPPAPGRPGAIRAGEPQRTPTDRRWCENVTLTLHNTGDLPVTSGTVTFATHVIGGLGIDWGSVTSHRPLPVPIAGGERREASWRICVDAWRVPWGMRIETRSARISGT
ncbi:hypothetical protein [Streptomyces sp. URMC 123]|uniref:hypothetical protein n=1 Tax=Streptomyces sp. URMC 123 TaxID=3423403 RepID=UPI003F19A238